MPHSATSFSGAWTVAHLHALAALACVVIWALLAAATLAQDLPLRDLAARDDILVGAAVAMAPLRNDSSYSQTLAREYDLVVAENAFKWSSVHPGPDTYDFSDVDALVEFAEAHGMAVRGHTLVWHNQNPGWLEGALTSREAAIAMLRDHIETVVGHLKGKILAWDVVNEAIDDATGNLRDTPWLRAIGPDYIALAFRFAHEADPGARLYYNDYGAEGGGRKSDAVYALVEKLKADGVPIDGVGWQMHIQNGTPMTAAYASNAARLAALGLEISITELDVRMRLPATDFGLRQQADTYGEVARFCRRQSNCKAIVTWGFTDAHSWVPGFFSGWGAALPFDESYRPKPAYAAIEQALSAP
jgi:endo-1,4-beta-xylanase